MLQMSLFFCKASLSLNAEIIERKSMTKVVHNALGKQKTQRGKKEEKQGKEKNKGERRGRQRHSPGKLLVTTCLPIVR